MRKRKVHPVFLNFPWRSIRRRVFFITRHQTPEFSSLPKFLSLRQTAKILEVHPNTLRSWDAAGKLRAVRFGARQDRRYVRDEVAAFWSVTTQVNRRHPTPSRWPSARHLGWSASAGVLVLVMAMGWSQFTAKAEEPGTTTLTAVASSCVGWANADAAERIQRPAGTSVEVLTDQDAARITTQDLGISGEPGRVTATFDQISPILTCAKFSTVGQQGGTLSNVRLQIFIATSGATNSTDLVRISTSLDGKTWEVVASEPMIHEDQGAVTVALPSVTDLEHVSALQVRFEPDFAPDGESTVAVDGLQVVGEVAPLATSTTQSSDTGRKRELDRLTAFSQDSYTADDQPTITVPKKETKPRYIFGKKTEEWKLQKVVLVDSTDNEFAVQYSANDEVDGDDVRSRLRLRMTTFHPGKYQLRVTMISPSGTTETITEPFLWGVVAVNLRRANPAVRDRQEITVGVLDDAGHTICNARVRATVTDPRGRRTSFDTNNKTITTNPNCVDKGVTNEADYHFSLVLDHTGVYRVSVVADTTVGERRIEENFIAEATQPFTVERVDYPTRIFPPAEYPVRIAVTPKKDYLGLVTEEVPTNFKISEIFPAATLRTVGTTVKKQFIEWLVEWKAGQTYYLTYTFDAPDISPALFLTGPLTVGGSFIAAPDFQESRQWQIASDAVSANGNFYYGDTTNAGKIKMTPFTTASTYGTEVNVNLGPAVNIMHVVAKTAPTREEKMIGFISGNPTTAGRLDIVTGTTGFEAAGDYTLRWTATAVSGTQDCDAAPTAGTCTQPFDLGYEALSGRGLVAYAGDSDANSTTDTDVFYYALWDGSAWSPDTTPNTPSATNQINLPGTAGTPRWIRVVPAGDNLADDRSNRAMVLIADSNDDLFAFYWDGSTFDSGTTLISTLGNCASARCFDGNWQGNTTFVVNYTNSGVSEVRYQKYVVGTGWGGDTQAFTTAATPSFLFSSADPTSSRIMISNFTSGNDTRGAVWRADNATDGWTVCASGGCPDTAAEGIGGPQAGAVFERFGGQGLHVFNDAANGTAQGNKYMTYTPTSTWGTASTTGITPSDDHQFTKLIPSPSSDDIMIVAADVDCDVDATMWDGTAPSTVGSNFELVLSSSNGSCANAVPIVGMMTTGGIDFAWNVYSPWGLNWRWTGDTSNATPGSYLANENVTPTGVADATTVRLRYGFVNRGTTAQALSAEGRKKLQFTTDSPDSLTATWTDVDADNGAGIWRYNNCTAGTDDSAIPSAVLTAPSGGSNIVGDFIEGSGNITMTHSAGPAVAIENDYCIEANGVAGGTTYYFRAFDNEQLTPVYREQDNDGAVDCATAACTYPSLTTLSTDITVSGGCFTDESEGAACTDDGADQIKVAVNGTLQSGVDTTVDGSWTFTVALPSSGATMVFFRDGEVTAGEEATTVVKYDGSGNVDGVKMYQSQLVLGTDTGSANSDQTISVADLDTTTNGYENSDDEDVIYDVTAGADLTVDAEADKTEQLYIITGDTFRPASGGGSDVTTFSLEFEGTLTTDNNAVNVAGDFTNAGTFTASTGTITFNGAVAQAFTTNAAAYNAITLNNTGTAGATDDLNVSGNLDVNSTLTITDGDLDLAAADPNVTTAGDVNLNASTALVTKADNGTATWTFDGTGTSTWTDSATTTQDLGLVIIDGTTKTVNMGSSVRATKLTVTDTFGLASSGYTLTLTGTGQAAAKPLTVTGTFNEGTNSTVDYIGNGATDITLETYWNLSVRPAGTATHYVPSAATMSVSGNLVIGDGSNAGTFNLSTNAASIDVNGNMTINPSAVFSASGSGDIWVGGSYANSGTFTSNSGNFTFDATSSGKTVSGSLTGANAFGKLVFNGTNGEWTVQNSMDVTDSFDVGAGTLIHGANTTLAVTGATFTLTAGITWTKTSGTGKLLLDNVTELLFADNTTPKQNLGVVQIGASPGTTTLSTDMSADSVTIPTGDTFNTKGYEVTTTGAFDCQGTCTLDLTSTGGEADGTILDIGGDFTMSSTATFTSFTNSKVFLNSTAGTDTNRTFTTGGKAYNDVELKNAGGTNDDITISGSPFDVNGVLTLTDGQIRLDTNDPNVTLAGNLSIAAAATVTKADNGTATWTFDGTGTSTWTDSTSGVQDLGLVSINGTTKTINLASSAKATKLTIAASQIFGLGSSGYTFTLTGSGQTTARPLQNSGTLNEGTNSTFAFTGTAATDIDPETFYHLTLAPSAAGSPTYYIDPGETGTTTASGNLVMGDTTNTVTVSATGLTQVDVDGDVTINANATFVYGTDMAVTVGGSFTNNGTNTDQSEGITFNGTATGKTISGNLTGANKFSSLVFSGSGGEWTSNGSVEANYASLAAGTWTGTGNVTINLGVNGTAGVVNRTGGTFEVRPNIASSFGPTTASTAWTFNDLTFGNSHASTPITITTQNCSTCTVTVSGVLRVGKSGDAAGATTTLTGATTTWSLTGTSADPFILLSSPAGAFTANTSTVNYNGVNGSGNVNVTTTTYSGLGCSPGSAEILNVAGSFTVSALLTIGTNCSFTIASSQTTTLSANTGTSLTLNGTLTGTGRLTYQNSATTFPTSGTISGGILRFDMVNGSMTMPVRTDYGQVEAYQNVGAARVLTAGTAISQTLTITGHLHIYADSAFNTTFEANTYDPTINVTGDIDFLGSGGGTEILSVGAGTWTVSGDVNLTDGSFSNATGNTLVMNGTGGKTLTPNNATLYNFTVDPTSSATINISTTNVGVTNNLIVGDGDTLNINTTLDMDNTTTCSVNLNTTGTITSPAFAGTFWYGCSATFPSSGTVSNYWLIPNATNTDLTFPGRAFTGSPTTIWFYNTGASNRIITIGTAGGQTFSATANIRVYANSTGNLTVDASTNNPDFSTITDLDFVENSTGQATFITGSGTHTYTGNVNMTNGTYTASTGHTLAMSGASKTLTTAGNSLYNFTLSGGSTTMSGTTTLNNNLLVSSGTLTAPSAGALNVGGNFTNSATFTHNNSTVTMTGSTKNIVGGSTNFYNLTINPTAASGTITATTNDFTVTNGLTIAAGDTLSLDTGRMISVTSAAEITWGDSAATISGAGKLRFTNTSGGPGTGGTLSADVRFDATTAAIASTTIDARIYSGDVELYKLVTAARTVTLASGSYTFGSILITGNADTNPGNLALVGSTGNPTVAVTGDVYGEDVGGLEDHTINMGSGVWTVGGNFDLTFITTFTHNSGTLAMNGATKVLTLDGQTLNNFQVTGGAVSVADTNITVAGTVTLSSGTFTAPSGTMSVAGNWTNSGGSFTPNNGTVSFNGGGTQTVTTANTMTNVGCGGSAVGQTANKQFYNFVVAGGTVVLATNSDLGVDGNFQITSGSFDIRASDANYLYLKGNLDLDAVTGTAFNMRESTWTGGCGQIIMVGSSATQRIYVQAGQTYNAHSIIFGDINATERTYYLSSSSASTATFRYQEYAIILSGTVDTKDGSQGTVNFNWNGTGQGQLYVGDDFGEHSATTKIFNANDATLSLGGIIVSDGQVSNAKPSTFNAMTATITTTGGTDGRIFVGNSAQPTRDDNTFDASTATTNAMNLKAVYIDLGDIQATSNRAWTLTDPGASSTFTMANNTTFNAAGSTSTWLIAGGMDFGTGVTFTTGSTTFTQNGTGAAVIDADTDVAFNSLTLDDTGSRTITIRDNDTSNRRVAVNGTFTWDQTVAANAANLSLGASTFTMTFALDNATVVNSTMSIPSGKTLTFANASTLELAGDYINAGTLAESTGKILMDGTNSSIINTGCATPAACTSQNLYNLEINKTAAGAGDDNVTVTTNGINVANTLTVTDGELIQGALDIRVEGATAVSVASVGTWTNISTGDLTLGGTFTTAGTVTFNSNNGTQCGDGANDIVINSTVADTTRLWTNTGTLALYNVEADDMTNASITAYNSDLSDPQTTWVAGSCGITLSGTVYQTSNEASGYGCNADNLTIWVAVNGDATPDTGTCTAADGTFSISNVTDPGAANIPVAIYIDSGESVKATTVTLSSAGATNITGISVMIDRVIVTQENATALTNAHMSTADNGNAGVRYAVSAGNLTTESGMELHVLSGKTFTPGGTVTTTATGTAAGAAGDLHIAGVLTMGTNSLTVGGDYNNAGTFNKTNTQTTTLAATGTGFAITPGTGDMNNLTISGDGGGNGTYTLSGANLTVDGTLTVNAGDTLTIDTSRTLTNTGATNVDNDGTINGGGTLQFTSASAGPDSDANSTGAYSATVRYNATAGNIATTTFDARTYGGRLELYQDSTTTTNRTVTPATDGTYTIGSHFYLINDDAAQTLTLAGSTASAVFTISGDLDFTGVGASSEIIQSGNDVWTVAGNVDVRNGTYTATSGNELKMTGTANVYGNNQSFYKLTIDGAGTTVTTQDNFTITNALTVGGAADGNNDTFNINGGVVFSSSTGSVVFGGSGTDTIGGTGNLIVRNDTIDTDGAFGDTVTVTYDTSQGVAGLNVIARQYKTLSIDNYVGEVGETVTLGTAGGQTITVENNFRIECTGCEIGGSPNTVDGDTFDPTVNVTGNVQSFDPIGGTHTISLGSGVWTVGGNVDFSFTGTLNHNSGTLVMNGTGTLTSNAKTLHNFTTSGSGTITLASATHTFAGNIILGSSATLTPGTSTVVMNGTTKTIDGGGKTLSGFTVSGSTTTLQNTDLTVSGTLTISASQTLAINSGLTLTHTGATLTWGNGSSTISGAGTLRFTDASGGPATGGVISAVTRYDATNGSIASTTIDGRTYSGVVELYSNSTSARTVTLDTVAYVLSGASSNFHVIAANTADLTVAANTNNPAVTIGGNLDFTGTGSGFEVIAAGTGTWTVSGNVDFTNGVYAPLVWSVTPTAVDTAQRDNYIDPNLGCALSTTYSCLGSGTVNYGYTDIGDCINNVEDQHQLTNRGWMQYDTTVITDGVTVTSAVIGANVTATYSTAINVDRSSTDNLNGSNCTVSNGTYAQIGGSDYGTVSLSATGNKNIPLGATGVADVQSRLTGTNHLSIGLNQSSQEGSMGAITAAIVSRPVLYVGYYSSGSPALVMNGSSKTLTPAGNGFYNLSISGTVTFANEPILVSGDLNLTGGDVTPGTATVTMLGAGKTLTAPVAGDTIYNLTIDPVSSGTVTFAAGGGDLTVSNALSVAAGETLSLGSGRTMTMSAATGINLTLSGTISGAGRLTYMSNATFPTGGTISSILRFDATSAASQSIASRTYGGAVEIYNNSGGAKTVASSSGTMAFSSTLDLSVGSGSVTLDLNTTDPTTTTVTGALTIGANATLSAPSTNAFNINGNYTNNGTFTDNSGTVTLAGSAQQTLSGTMTGSSDFNNLVVTNVSGSDPDSSPSVIFASGANTAATFTATTANTKLRFNAGSTYMFVNFTVNGQATGTRVYLRSSANGTQWNLTSTGTQTVSNTDVRDSYACGGDSIDASDGTSQDSTNNHCWNINTISLTISDLAIGFGACTAGAARYATGDATGAAADSADAHTLSVATNARGGYSLTLFGSTLTSAGNTITAIGGTALASNPGSEQYGLRAIKNSGTGTVSSPFDTANWAFTAGSTQQIASYAGASSSYSAVYGIRYICNVAELTQAGNYSTDMTYVLTSTF